MKRESKLEVRATCDHGTWTEVESPVKAGMECPWCEEVVPIEYKVTKVIAPLDGIEHIDPEDLDTIEIDYEEGTISTGELK